MAAMGFTPIFPARFGSFFAYFVVKSCLHGIMFSHLYQFAVGGRYHQIIIGTDTICICG